MAADLKQAQAVERLLLAHVLEAARQDVRRRRIEEVRGEAIRVERAPLDGAAQHV